MIDIDPRLLWQLSQLDLPFDVGVAVRGRLEVGAREYGHASLERPAAELLTEAAEEPLDVIGWSVLALARLQRDARPPAELRTLEAEVRDLTRDAATLAIRAQALVAVLEIVDDEATT